MDDDKPLGKMKRRTVSVQDMNGKQVEADRVVCPGCDSYQWTIFRIKGQDHIHLQCADCDMTYCPLEEDAHGGFQ